jgi:hypothetical protein
MLIYANVCNIKIIMGVIVSLHFISGAQLISTEQLSNMKHC